MTMSIKPLSGVRVLDLTRVVSGPFCTMMLGDLGAEVIKIEAPDGGDESRGFGPPFIAGESAYFLAVNRNKQSVALDLRREEGKRAFERLVAVSDVLVENFRPGTLERLGFGDATLAALNPRLVRCSISGFGQSGAQAQRPGYDLIVQGESGIMDITGAPGGPPTKVGTSIADLVTGLYAAQGVMAALIERERSGRATPVDVSMLDATASLLAFNAGIYFATGASPTRRGNAHPTIYPYETFEAADGWINVGVANDKFWALFCEAIGTPELLDDERFATAPKRVQNRAALAPRLAERLKGRTREAWIETLSAAGVPCGMIRSVGEAVESLSSAGRGMVLRMQHPTAGEVANIQSPLRFADRGPGEAMPPPRLGEHSDRVLAEVAGLDRASIERLRSAGVVGPNPPPAPAR